MFDPNYEVILADTEAARAIHRKIRYHVYCIEHAFESTQAFPFGEEHDPWDIHATQFIVRQRASGQWVAAMRMVLPSAVQFPVETLDCLTPKLTNPLHRRELAEISRICVIHSPAPHEINRCLDRNFGSVARNEGSQVLLGMIRAVVLYGIEKGIKHSYLLITDAVARLLRRVGVVLHLAGTPTDHRGLRTPYWVGLRESAVSMSAKSDVIRRMFARKALAYRPFSTLDDNKLPHPFPLPTAETSWRVDVEQSRPGRGPWRIETGCSKPGPGVWRLEAERSQPGPGAWRRAAPG